MRIIRQRMRPHIGLFALSLQLGATQANARPIRRLFEPTDLEQETPGDVELDVQLGVIRGSDAYRLSVPDFELDVGLTRQIELDIDGALALEGPTSGAFRFDHLVVDNLWVALKSGLFSFADPGKSRVFSTGLQLGPKLPTARQAHGIGVESLLLCGLLVDKNQFILNFGALVDPSVDSTSRPAGVEGGVSYHRDLDADGKWSIVADVGAVHFLSPDPGQLHGSCGIGYAPNSAWSFSAVGLAGVLRGSDQYGLLLGVSPKLRLFGR